MRKKEEIRAEIDAVGNAVGKVQGVLVVTAAGKEAVGKAMNTLRARIDQLQQEIEEARAAAEVEKVEEILSCIPPKPPAPPKRPF